MLPEFWTEVKGKIKGFEKKKTPSNQFQAMRFLPNDFEQCNRSLV
jgi:hypothetical protein